MSNQDKQKMKLFKAELTTEGWGGSVKWVPVWARNVDEAAEAAGLEYGEDNVGRVRPEVTHG